MSISIGISPRRLPHLTSTLARITLLSYPPSDFAHVCCTMGGQEKTPSIGSEATSVNEGQLEKDIEKEAESAEKGTDQQPSHRNIEFDQGEEHLKFRRRWYQLW